MTDKANPVQVACPACNAQPGNPCTAPTSFGRRTVTWVHSSREDLAKAIAEESVDEQIDAVVTNLTQSPALHPLPSIRGVVNEDADSPGKSTPVYVIVADDPHPESPGEPVFSDTIVGIYVNRQQALDQAFTRSRRQPMYEWSVALWDAETSTVLGNVASISSNRGAGHFDPAD